MIGLVEINAIGRENACEIRFIVLCFQADKDGGLEVLDEIFQSWPDLIVWLEMIAKVGAKPAGNGLREDTYLA
jgi:hypothetical protein